jgi:DNA-directed RNA polymerase subunit RPC12/RpoP
VTVCQEVVEGCPDCEAEAAFKGDHLCDDMCRFWGKQKRNGDEFHRLTHEPERCEDCGGIVSDKRGYRAFDVRACKAGYCTEWYCTHCGATTSSSGPMECPTCGSLRHLFRERISRMHQAYARRR